jgi:hypothetical protein
MEDSCAGDDAFEDNEGVADEEQDSESEAGHDDEDSAADASAAPSRPGYRGSATLLGRRKSEELNLADLKGLHAEQEVPSKRGKPFVGGWGLRRQRRFSLPITIGRSLLEEDNGEDDGLRDKRFDDMMKHMISSSGAASLELLQNFSSQGAAGGEPASEHASHGENMASACRSSSRMPSSYANQASGMPGRDPAGRFVSFHESHAQDDTAVPRAAPKAAGRTPQKMRRRSCGDALGSIPQEFLLQYHHQHQPIARGPGRPGMDVETVQKAMSDIHLEESEHSESSQGSSCDSCGERAARPPDQEPSSSGSSDEAAKAQLAELYCQALQNGDIAVPPALMPEGDILVVPLPSVTW